MSRGRIKPYEGTDPYIFVSYAHRDYDRIEPILQGLIERGYRLWYDEGIDPGTEWPESIATHLEKSRVCLSFISPFSAASRNCRREINFALTRNIDLLTVFLEKTQLSPGLEMQISTYQSVMGYAYGDISSLLDRIISIDVLAPCRGTSDEAGTGASAPSPGKQSTDVTRSRKRLPLMLLLPLFLIAAAAVFRASYGSGRKTETAGSAGQVSETAAAVLPTADAAQQPAAEVTDAPDRTPSPQPEAPPREIPEGFRILLTGTWTDGSVLICGDDASTVYVELTDDRIPYAYPMSETRGNNDPTWEVEILLGGNGRFSLEISGSEYLMSFDSLHTRKSLQTTTEILIMEGFRYRLQGNTFCIKTMLPEGYTTEDVTQAVVHLGTENGSERFYAHSPV